MGGKTLAGARRTRSRLATTSRAGTTRCRTARSLPGPHSACVPDIAADPTRATAGRAFVFGLCALVAAGRPSRADANVPEGVRCELDVRRAVRRRRPPVQVGLRSGDGTPIGGVRARRFVATSARPTRAAPTRTHAQARKCTPSRAHKLAHALVQAHAHAHKPQGHPQARAQKRRTSPRTHSFAHAQMRTHTHKHVHTRICARTGALARTYARALA